MICANCGRRIPEGQQICPHCDDSAKDYSHEIKSVKPGINNDTLECPICSLKDISPKEESCPQCKIKFIHTQWVCDSCKAQNRYQTVKCVHCGKVRNGNVKSAQPMARQGMAFYHYLIYFGLFASAALSFYSGCVILPENGLLGFYHLIYGVFALVARFLLAARDRSGLKLYMGMLCVDSFVTFFSMKYMMDMISSETSKVIDTYGAYASQAVVEEIETASRLGSTVGVWIGTLVTIGINGAILKYFANREDCFNKSS